MSVDTITPAPSDTILGEWSDKFNDTKPPIYPRCALSFYDKDFSLFHWYYGNCCSIDPTIYMPTSFASTFITTLWKSKGKATRNWIYLDNNTYNMQAIDTFVTYKTQVDQAQKSLEETYCVATVQVILTGTKNDIIPNPTSSYQIGNEELNDLSILRNKTDQLCYELMRILKMNKSLPQHSEFSWINYFSKKERKEFLNELVKTSHIASSIGNWFDVEGVIECWKETAEILSNDDIVNSINTSLEQIERGETISWEDVQKELNIA